MAEPTFSDAEGLNVPIELPPQIAKLLAQPICLDISLPKPVTRKLTLPMGGHIASVVDTTKQIPDNCSANFSLLLQLGPMLAPLKCILAILGLITPLIDIIKGLPFPPVKAISDFIKAAEPVVHCVAEVTVGVPLFIRDIICLIIKLLQCLIDQLRSIIDLLDGLSIQISAAQDNPQLLATLQCAQENAQNAAAGAMQGFEPIVAILDLIGPLVEQVSGSSIEIPALGPAESLEEMNKILSALEEFSNVLNLVAEGLGGCE